MEAPCGSKPIIQIHPTRRCNLRCLHCYSESSPDVRETLRYEKLAELLDDAREEGYSIASFSGGEPMLYPRLAEVLRHAKHLGMRTTVTSNGMLLTPARLERLAGLTDVLAISLDGMPEAHDRMRAFPGAFARMEANLESVRQSGIPFGFIFTLTLHNVNEVDWAAAFAASQGAKLFQIHPLEAVGRAETELPGKEPDQMESAYAFLEAERLRVQYEGKMHIHLDVVHRDLLRHAPERFYAGDMRLERRTLSESVSPLVVRADGLVLPLGYNFSREYAVGNIVERRLRELAPAWIARTQNRFRALCRRVFDDAATPSELPFLNWYEMIESRSRCEELVQVA